MQIADASNRPGQEIAVRYALISLPLLSTNSRRCNAAVSIKYNRVTAPVSRVTPPPHNTNESTNRHKKVNSLTISRSLTSKQTSGDLTVRHCLYLSMMMWFAALVLSWSMIQNGWHSSTGPSQASPTMTLHRICQEPPVAR